MRNSSPQGGYHSSSPDAPTLATKLAAVLAFLPLLYVLWLQFAAQTRHRFFIHPDAFVMFLFVISTPNILLYVCVRISGRRTAWVCVSALFVFVAIDCWLFSVGAGPFVAPGLGYIELMVGGVLLPIAVATGDRRTGL